MVKLVAWPNLCHAAQIGMVLTAGERVEATPGIEPGYKDLQSSA